MGLRLSEFNINELAGATGLMLGALGGILAMVLKSRCYCKFRVGFTDNCNICMCERKPPVEVVADSSDEEAPAIIPNKDRVAVEPQPELQPELQPEPEQQQLTKHK